MQQNGFQTFHFHKEACLMMMFIPQAGLSKVNPTKALISRPFAMLTRAIRRRMPL
jgi:hypothetical protein